jgi:hypothetical protein
MEPGQNIAYISDIGAQRLKPLFIAMGAVTVVTFDLGFIIERWLRHTGRLARNTSLWQKFCSIASMIAAIAGGAGFVLLTIFDTLHHDRLHDAMLGLFIGGYVVSAIFICWEYQRLGIHFRETSVLRYSFWIKLFFIIIEVCLAIAFGVCQKYDRYNAAAVLEWTVSFIFFFYVLSFFIDFMPASRSKGHQSKATEMEVADTEAAHGTDTASRYYGLQGHPNGQRHDNAATNGYATHEYSNGHAMNGVGKHAAPVPASQNY